LQAEVAAARSASVRILLRVMWPPMLKRRSEMGGEDKYRAEGPQQVRKL
jgi:hypothetical protein